MQKKMQSYSCVLVLVLLLVMKSTACESSPTVRTMDEKSEREIAVAAEFEISQEVSNAAFKECVPKESAPFPNLFSPDLESKVFDSDALSALMKCSKKDCAFNFLPDEVSSLEKEKKAEDRKKSYFEFFKNRTLGRTPMDASKKDQLIRSSDQAFENCNSVELSALLDKRPLERVPFRLSHVRYSSKMRPTTRLLQGKFYELPKERVSCYAEALIFSDHYDLDRVEIWSLANFEHKASLKLQVRHRIDLLKHWVARLNKAAFINELKQVIVKQVDDAATCMQQVDLRPHSSTSNAPAAPSSAAKPEKTLKNRGIKKHP